MTLQETYQAIKQANKVKQKGIMIATPMYGGQCNSEYAVGLINTSIMLSDLGFNFRYRVMSNESLITRARNMLARDFIEDESMDYLLFIDSDVGFTEVDVFRLIAADRDMAAGVYPKKRIVWDTVRKAALAGKDKIEDYIGEFVFNLIDKDKDGSPDEQGMLEVREAATGFLMIKRKVFEVLEPHVPTYKEYRHDGTLFETKDYFQIGVSEKTGFYVSEDYFFCNLWREHGGQIFINPYINLSHTGSYVFRGNLARMGSEPL